MASAAALRCVGGFGIESSRNRDSLQYLNLVVGNAGARSPWRGQTDPKPAARRMRVLVVDDEAANLEFVERCLRSEFEVHTASSADEGLAYLGENDYELIISDQRMPGMSGSDFLAASLARAPSSIRIIITGFADLDAIADAVNKANISGYVRKPFSAAELDDAISRAQRLRALGAVQGPGEHRDAFQMIVEEASHALGVLAHGELIYLNPQLRRLLACSSASALSWAELAQRVHEEDRETLAQLLQRAAEAPAEAHLRLRTAQELTAVQVRAMPLQLQGGAAVVLHVLEAVPSAAAPSAGVREDEAHARILVIDDHELMLRALRRALRGCYDVLTAASGAEAMSLLAEDDRFDLVVCALDMPDQSGIGLYRFLEHNKPQLSHRFVFTTALPEGAVGATVPRGALGCLRKPFALEEVHELVRSVTVSGQE